MTSFIPDIRTPISKMTNLACSGKISRPDGTNMQVMQNRTCLEIITLEYARTQQDVCLLIIVISWGSNAKAWRTNWFELHARIMFICTHRLSRLALTNDITTKKHMPSAANASLDARDIEVAGQDGLRLGPFIMH